MLPRTNCLYLEDTSLHESQATIVAIDRLDDGNPTIILDRTIFYPKSGGQPSDTGFIMVSDGIDTHDIPVDRVRINAGVVEHDVCMRHAPLLPDAGVRLRIDGARRMLNTRLHSAGELICAAVRNLGRGNWRVASASHYPGQAKISFADVYHTIDVSKFQREIEDELARLIEANEEVRTLVVHNLDDAQRLCGFRPGYLNQDQPIRIVIMSGNLGRPCVGTHVARTGEIGSISIRRIRGKG